VAFREQTKTMEVIVHAQTTGKQLNCEMK